MTRERIKVPVVSTKKMTTKINVLASSIEEKYKERMNSANFQYLVWKWKYRLQSDNTIRFRIVT